VSADSRAWNKPAWFGVLNPFIYVFEVRVQGRVERLKRGFLAASMSLLTALFLSHSPADAAGTECLPGEIKAALAHVKRNYGDVSVLSAYRKGASIIGTRNRSKHARCQAVDFHIRRNRQAAVQWLRKQNLEVITYGCSMHHIHIATGSYKGHHCVDSKGRRKR
jgi:uncharacterized protein YcbK (DUF882 family)